jgi:hypothetical protein
MYPELFEAAQILNPGRPKKRAVNAGMQHYELVSRYADRVAGKLAEFSLEASIQTALSADAGKETDKLKRAMRQLQTLSASMATLEKVRAVGADHYETRATARREAAARLATLADDVASSGPKKDAEALFAAARASAAAATDSRAHVRYHVAVQSEKAAPKARRA